MFSMAKKWAMGFGIILLLVCTPSLALAQASNSEMRKQQLQFFSLIKEIIAVQERMLSSATLHKETAFDLLTEAGKNLEITRREVEVLLDYISLASLVTEKKLTPKAMKIIRFQLGYMRGITALHIESLEKTMHISSDEETTQLLLKSRDLFRSSVELLDRVQVPEPTVQ